MGENWLREYIFLAFRIHKLAEAVYGSPFVETYYGPPVAEDRAAAMVTFLKHPMGGPYNLAYVAGQRLMRPLLKRPDRSAMFRRLLTEQFAPSQLQDGVPPLHPE